MIVAIDGFAATGKSTSAKLIAHELGFTYLDTGAMYRCVTLSFLNNDINLENKLSLIALLEKTEIEFKNRRNENLVFLNGENVSADIRKTEVTSYVSKVSSISEVRNFLVKSQREIAKNYDCVIEGRDIGTVVFPNAEVKFFLVADSQIRAERRHLELLELKEKKSIKTLMEEIQKRDSLDSNRENSPLQKAKDAIEVDTTKMTINSQVEFMVNKVKLITIGK
ncbi:MAG: (d)CMP kinase [Candidatus Marinimicrobia bacterium]|jgi:cytidylate kinase|nr:(d)CMP kinase [Candidatus Neomarinimicrobiota bacterium]MBT4318537.1 (d)CMP kinase [Candidatus Neomarinimicrobiota bacterium]MBT5097510.1 (d)CMP kinase [Candidatus Neomarinimicrobiota bacterium]MBT5439897.1 (d)CMP kinase [Candidatus Neomarinimicrobiota bacterium]